MTNIYHSVIKLDNMTLGITELSEDIVEVSIDESKSSLWRLELESLVLWLSFSDISADIRSSQFNSLFLDICFQCFGGLGRSEAGGLTEMAGIQNSCRGEPVESKKVTCFFCRECDRLRVLLFLGAAYSLGLMFKNLCYS